MTLLEPPGVHPQPLFADRLHRHGDSPALITADHTVTYDELDERVAELTARLGPERCLILLAADNTIQAVVAYLAALHGRHPLVLAPSRDDEARRAIIDAYRPDVIAEDGDLVHLRARSTHRLHRDLALLLSTSGSTGSPKLVRLSRDNLASNAAAIADYLALTPVDRAITTLPMWYCYGLSVINSHLHAGAAVALTSLSVIDPCFWDLFEAVGATSFAGVPHTFELLDRVAFDAMELPTLRYITQAGGRMHPDTVRRYAALGAQHGWQLFVMYGQTEATARMAYLPPRLAASHPGAVGVAIPGGRFTIDAPDDRGVGELIYRGPNVMLGYAETAADLAHGRTVTALHTGDLARCNDTGLIEIVGRASRLVKPFGVRVDLDDLERLLAEHGIATLCTGDDRYLTIGIDRSGDPSEVHRLVDDRLRLPRSRVRVVQLDALPRLTSGKPDYAALSHRAPADPIRAAPTTSDEEIRVAFAETLGVDPDEDDTFVTLGGDSLSYVEMSVRLEELLGTVPHDWHLRTPRELAGHAEERAPRRWCAHLETTAVLRAVAIVLIVSTHTRLWYVPGGAHALLAVAGFNFARFQLRGTSRFTSVARIALPSMVWIGLVAAVSDDFSWPHALLVNDLVGRPDARWAYWFIEALVQILIPLGVLFLIPAAARAERRRPFLVASLAVAAGLAVRFDFPVVVATDHRVFRPQEVFWLFALGWAAAQATSRPQRALVTTVAVASTIGFFGDPHRGLVVMAAVALITWLPAMPVPRPVVSTVANVAGASLYVYLTHFQVHPPLTRVLGPTAGVIGSVAVGVGIWFLARRIIAWCERRLGTSRSQRGELGGSKHSLAAARDVATRTATPLEAVLQRRRRRAQHPANPGSCAPDPRAWSRPSEPVVEGRARGTS